MKTNTGMTLSEDAMRLLDMVAAALGLSRSAVVEIIVRYYVAHSQDFELEHDKDV